MEKKNKKNTHLLKYILNGVGMTVVAAIFIGGTIFSTMPIADRVTNYLEGSGAVFGDDFKEGAKLSKELNRQIVGEGSVLLKNDTKHDGGLPLKKETTKVNLFGWSSTKNGFINSGIGSGLSNTTNKISLQQALKDDGIEVNQSLVDFYENYYNKVFVNTVATSDRVMIYEPSKDMYSPSLIEQAKNYSDTAICVISRQAGENINEVPLNQPHYNGATDNSRNMLQIAKEEEDMLKIAEDNFKNVIVVLNTGNAMETSFLKSEGIDAALNCGIVGENGTQGIADIITGKVTPSGRTVDTFISNHKDYDPTYKVFDKAGNNTQYLEDIYFGYKYYETRYGEVENEYKKIVDYPFGYGLSYTTFKWDLTNVSLPDGSDLVKESSTPLAEGETDNSKVTLTFNVTNTGKYSGKDVLELYYTAPYTNGGIEKSAINLVDFAKTAELKPGQTQTGVTMSFSTYDLASYDAYDKNNNGKKTWELDPGEYKIKVMTNAHTLANVGGMTDGTLTYNVPETSEKTGYYYLRDPKTNKRVQNRFTDTRAYSGVPSDGSTVGLPQSYMSRTDFNGTYPSGLSTPNGNVATADNYVSPFFDTTVMPKTNQDNGLYLFTNEDGSKASAASLTSRNGIKANMDLIKELVTNWNSPKWDQLLDQMDFAKAKKNIEIGGWGTDAMEEFGKPAYTDSDGPQGFNNWSSAKETPYTGFACETTLGQTWSKDLAKAMGQSIGTEGSKSGTNGWYAPAVNLHRSQFNFRNYEYFAEDPVLSGKMGANVINGAKSNGVYAYLKHFALSELGQNAFSVNCWITEQNLRENYLKAFEISVKEGGANAVMTAFNGIGGAYCGQNYALNVSILRNEWGFKGSLITDFAGTNEMKDAWAFVRGGNDLCLVADNSSKLSADNPTDVYCVRQSTKNIIYTDIDTYYYSQTYDHKQDGSNANIGTGLTATNASFPWWKTLLYTLDGVAVIGLGIWAYFAFFHKPSKKNPEDKKKD